jgi:alkylhydroperoxidase family enzyme
LILKSSALGLPYGAYVGRLVRGVPLPVLAVDRATDRAALMTSCDRLAQLSADLAALIRMLRSANSEGAEKYRASSMSLDSEVRRHLDLASQLIAHQGERR